LGLEYRTVLTKSNINLLRRRLPSPGIGWADLIPLLILFSVLFDVSLQDSRLGLGVFREHPSFLLHSLSIHPITPVLCVSCVNSVSMPSCCSLGIYGRALPRDPDDSGSFYVVSSVAHATPSLSTQGLVGWHVICHALIHPGFVG
jgi:hypothetical protein